LLMSMFLELADVVVPIAQSAFANFNKVGWDGIFGWNCLKFLCHVPDFLP